MGGDTVPRGLKGDLMVRRGPAARAFYGICKLLFRIVGALLFDLRCFGPRRVPRGGPVVIAANHQSYLDPVFLGICLSRRAFYLARENLFRLPGFRLLIRGLNALPIPRGTAASRRGIDFGRAVLRAGENLVLFPEGTRTRNGRMGPVKRGVEVITGPAGAPVVPAYIDGSFDVWPPGGRLRLRPVRIFFGTPLEGDAPRAEETCDESPRPEAGEIENGSSADLVARLEASFRRLEARARRVRWAGAAGASGRPHYFG